MVASPQAQVSKLATSAVCKVSFCYTGRKRSKNGAANNSVTESVQHSKWRDFPVEPNVCYRRLVISSGGVQNANTVACSEGAI